VIQYPKISPVILSIGPIQIRWYGMMYLAAFGIAYWMMHRLAARKHTAFSGERIADLLLYAALGVVIGGRLGYVLFYNLPYYLENPLEFFALWHGGLSFHGGFLGVLLAGYLFVKRYGLSFYEVADIVIIPVPIGLGLGRVGNFINGELFGRPTHVPWCMVFPQGGAICRHPSQVYEALLEGVVLFVCLWLLNRKTPPPGVLFWSFIGLYGLFRFLVEFTREPDPQLGLIAGPFSMGQMLSFPLAMLGFWMVWRRWRAA
jgi:phosphatidylglycerol:prolipoprotein diacylglycerol transferase